MTNTSNYSENWEIVIGLEVHVQLSSKTKMFTASEWNYGDSPNTNQPLQWSSARGSRVSTVFRGDLSSFVLAGSSGPWQYFAVDVVVFASRAWVCFDPDSVCLGHGRGPLPIVRAHHWWPGLSIAYFSRVSFKQQFFRRCCC